MPVHISQMSTEVTVFDGDLPLNETQINKLVALVLKRLTEKERELTQVQEATKLRRRAAPGVPIGE